ncbi:hypothetical protein F4809DRAFT_616622 [Biscogniauxia mediterranea]|nr:hypothetical protein F4809DRAFT_616622 [Biscogniauxia mediterranea]
MTTNSYGSALPTFDFPPAIAQVTKNGARRVPRSAKLVPLAAAAGLAYYVGAQISAQRKAVENGTYNTSSSSSSDDSAARLKAVQDAYGDRSSLQNLEAAARIYASSAVSKDP